MSAVLYARLFQRLRFTLLRNMGLRAGGSDYSYDLVKKAGVDLASPAPYRSIAARMDRIMDEIEAIRARQGRS